MQTLTRGGLNLGKIESDADFVLFSERHGLVSEHYTAGEAQSAFYREARRSRLGDYLPRIYQRDDDYWVPMS